MNTSCISFHSTMMKFVLILILISQIARALVINYEQAYSLTSYTTIQDDESLGYIDPRSLGGSMLDVGL